MKAKKKGLIGRTIFMKTLKSIHYYFLLVLSVAIIGCKSQSLETSAPFDIEEKSYFYWEGGKQGTEGTTIILKGHAETLNVSFSKLYFQNYEYDIVPEYSHKGFLIQGNYSKFRDMDMDKDPINEMGNEAKTEKKIPFDLLDDEAILLYSVNGREGYHKIKGIKQLEKVYMP